LFFGGQGNGNFNDMWKYDMFLQIFGRGWLVRNMEVPQETGEQKELQQLRMFHQEERSILPWKDPAGDFWIFAGNDSSFFTGGGSHNDLWKYNIATSMWTWVNGPSTVNGQRSIWDKMFRIALQIFPVRD